MSCELVAGALHPQGDSDARVVVPTARGLAGDRARRLPSVTTNPSRYEQPATVRYADWWPATVGDLCAALAVLPQDLHVARGLTGDIVLLHQPAGQPGIYRYAGRVNLRWGLAWLDDDPNTTGQDGVA